MKALLDTNVVIDLLLKREPWRIEAEAIASAVTSGRLVPYASASCITDIFYISRKLIGVQEAWRVVRTCLDLLQIIPVTLDILNSAGRRPGSDFEDNLQIECALVSALDAIITRDARGFKDSPIPALTPAECLAQLNPSP